MLTVASLLAAMTIAGAFWVGVLAARRLRDWGEGRRALEDGGPAPLALAAAVPPDDARTRKIRELVAQRLEHRRQPLPVGGTESSEAPPRRDELGPATLRSSDVVMVEEGDSEVDGDFIVEGVVLLREGRATTVIANMTDAGRIRWLIAGPDPRSWIVAEPVVGHGMTGEPARNIDRPSGTFTLSRRGQASAACTGRHGRPEQPRVATYLYRDAGSRVLWVERWDRELLIVEGRTLDAGSVSFLPGTP